jgi:hypothetical protein
MAATTLIPKSDSARFELLPVTSSSHRCILALDLGTTTGWALRGHDGLITSGWENWTVYPVPSRPFGSKRFAATRAPTRATFTAGSWRR